MIHLGARRLQRERLGHQRLQCNCAMQSRRIKRSVDAFRQRRLQHLRTRSCVTRRRKRSHLPRSKHDQAPRPRARPGRSRSRASEYDSCDQTPLVRRRTARPTEHARRFIANCRTRVHVVPVLRENCTNAIRAKRWLEFAIEPVRSDATLAANSRLTHWSV